MAEEFIPFALPCIGQEEIDEVVDSLKSGWLTTGPKTRRFEEAFAEFIGAGEAVAVNSATAGLHLALEAFGVGPGDRVLVPVYTFTATAEVVRYLGADPVFVDAEPGTRNMDIYLARRALESQPGIKAIVPVHFAGHPCDMDRLMALAAEFDVKVIEDAAHALPTEYRGRLIGGHGHAVVYSFYVTKTLATGEGGMVVSVDPDACRRMRTMRLHGINRDVFNRYTSELPAWYYEVVAPGYKYNMTDLAASLGIHQLKKVESFRKQREEIANRYLKAFADLPVGLPSIEPYCTRHAWHLFVLDIEKARCGVSRDEVIQFMASERVGSSVHFIPLHLHPYWRERYRLTCDEFPVAEKAYRQAMSLPIYPSMSHGAVERVISAVRSALER